MRGPASPSPACLGRCWRCWSLVCAFVAGLIWGLIPGALLAFWRVDIIVTTLMMSTIATLLTAYLVTGPFKDPAAGLAGSPRLADQALLKMFNPEYGIGMDLVIAVIITVVLGLVLTRSVWGMKVREVGQMNRFAAYAGVSPKAMSMQVMAMSGAVSGLAGAIFVLGPNGGRFLQTFSPGYGFLGITVALLARLNPWAAIVAAVFYANMMAGSNGMQINTSVPFPLVNVLQGLIILMITASFVLNRRRKRVSDDQGPGPEATTDDEVIAERDLDPLRVAVVDRDGRSGAVMSNVLGHILTATTLAVILMKVAPILLAAIGGAVTQQGNILNIGLEGMMLIGAFASIAVGSWAGNALVGVVAAVLSGLLLALLYAIATLNLKADFIVVGIGVNLLAAGLSVFLLQVLYGNPGVTPPDASINLPRIPLGPLAHIPVIGPAVDDQTPLVWLAFLCVPLYSYLLYRTRFGVHLRAVGEDEGAAEAAGISIRRMKFWSILISGVLCGLGGAQLAMATLGSFTAGMTSGRGFIAVAALTFGLAKPVRTHGRGVHLRCRRRHRRPAGGGRRQLQPGPDDAVRHHDRRARPRRCAAEGGPGRSISTRTEGGARIMTAQKVILDCDPGHDDAMAMLLAAGDPRIDLLAITTCAGNQTLAKVTRNALAVCAAAGIDDVPVAAGAAGPLVRTQMVAPDIHGESGLDGPVLPAPTRAVDPRHAVQLIIDTVMAHEPGEVTLVPTGPLTNIALAMRQEPAIVDRVKRVVLMGGAYTRGNRTPAAEFNIAADPEAAYAVFDAGWPVTMVGLDLTHQATATPDVVERIRAIGSPLSEFVVDVLGFFTASYKQHQGFDAPPCTTRAASRSSPTRRW